MIKMIPTFQTSDGVLHNNIDHAVSHERVLLIQHALVARKDDLGLPVASIDKLANVIFETRSEMNRVFNVDLKSGFHNGGAVESLRLNTPFLSKRNDAGVIKAKAIDAHGRVLYLGDEVRLALAFMSNTIDVKAFGGNRTRRIVNIQDDGRVALSNETDMRNRVWLAESLEYVPAVKASATASKGSPDPLGDELAAGLTTAFGG